MDVVPPFTWYEESAQYLLPTTVLGKQSQPPS